MRPLPCAVLGWGGVGEVFCRLAPTCYTSPASSKACIQLALPCPRLRGRVLTKLQCHAFSILGGRRERGTHEREKRECAMLPLSH